jgi:hypothetical protein
MYNKSDKDFDDYFKIKKNLNEIRRQKLSLAFKNIRLTIVLKMLLLISRSKFPLENNGQILTKEKLNNDFKNSLNDIKLVAKEVFLEKRQALFITLCSYIAWFNRKIFNSKK